MYKKSIFFLFSLLFYLNARTQVTESDTLSVSDFVEEMVGFDTRRATFLTPGQPPMQNFKNKKIRFIDRPKDMLYWNVMDPNQAAINDSITKAANYEINHKVNIIKCEFHENQILLFNHMVFNETVVINESSEFSGEFKDCDFNGGVFIMNSDISAIQFTNCTFNGFRFLNNETDRLYFTSANGFNQITRESIT